MSSIILDIFEGDEYAASTVVVETSTKEKVDCLTYLWKGDVLEKSWSNKKFRELHLKRYIDEVCVEYRASAQPMLDALG